MWCAGTFLLLAAFANGQAIYTETWDVCLRPACESFRVADDKGRRTSAGVYGHRRKRSACHADTVSAVRSRIEDCLSSPSLPSYRCLGVPMTVCARLPGACRSQRGKRSKELN